jgi:hypothetical protein
MTTTYRLETIHHAVDIATTLRMTWFRGHSKTFGRLVPRIFRPPYAGPLSEFFRQDIEFETIVRFRRGAASITDRPLPPEHDRLAWLCFMQHHGAPTRLLDWSERILVALYFAVRADPSEDGELWVLDPNKLNAAAVGSPGLPLSNSRALRFLARQAESTLTPWALAKHLKMPAAVENPIAFVRARDFRRVIGQSGAFTIHPKPQAGHEIHDLVPDECNLVRYLIPAASKRPILEALGPLGVSDFQLFQDFEALAREVCADHNIIGWGPPDPPKCGGLIPDPSGTT